MKTFCKGIFVAVACIICLPTVMLISTIQIMGGGFDKTLLVWFISEVERIQKL